MKNVKKDMQIWVFIHSEYGKKDRKKDAATEIS